MKLIYILTTCVRASDDSRTRKATTSANHLPKRAISVIGFGMKELMITNQVWFVGLPESFRWTTRFTFFSLATNPHDRITQCKQSFHSDLPI
jgi:hypothetical protein